jgi:mannitol-1-/sugar-/sorbitol-6-phosphatase
MTLISAGAMLFDMDGVLVDSIPAVERVWRNWAVEHGFDAETVVKLSHGRPSITTVRELLPQADHEAENRIIERREIADVAGVLPLPGARELLLSLPPSRWAIVTSCTRPLAEVRIRAAGLPKPSLLLTSSDVVHGKPHPEPYMTAARVLGFSPDKCIVVEDVPAGIRSGKAAGARVLALRTTASEHELEASQPDWICDNLANIRLAMAAVEEDPNNLYLQLDE